MIMNIPGYTGTSGGLSSGGLNLPGYTGQSGGLSGGGLNIPTMGNANISPQLASANPTGFQQFLTGAGNVLGDIFGGVQQIGSAISPAMPAIAGSLLTKEAYDRLSNVGDTAYQRSMDLAERGQQESQFRPFTVTTPTGSSFTARMGGQPQPPMLTGGPVAPPAGVFPIQPVVGGRDYMPQPPAGIMPPVNMIGRRNDLAMQEYVQNQNLPMPQPYPVTSGNEFNRRMDEEVMRLNPGMFGQPVTGGPVAPPPQFTPVLNQVPGTVADGDGAFGSGQGRERTGFTEAGLRALEMAEEMRRLNPDRPPPPRMRPQPMPIAPQPMPQPVTGGPVAPPAGMPAFRGAPDSQPAADAMARQYQQPMSQPQEGLEIGMSLSPEEQSMYEGLFGGAGRFFGQAQQPTAGREQEIFNRMRAAQMPEEQRQRLALEERLASQGRLGTSSAAYGGATPEMLAMATAQEEGRNRAMLGAMQQAQAEQMQQASLGQQFLGSSYLPQQQLLAALQPGLTQQQMAQQAQQFGTGLFGETALSGIEAQLLAEQARANLLGGVGSNILAGMFTPQTNRVTGVSTPAAGLGDLGGLFGGVGKGLGEIGRAIGIIK